MDPQILYYSYDKEITIGNLKEKTDFKWCDFSAIEKFMTENNVHWIIDWWEDFHYKFLLIKSKPYIIYYKWNLEILNKPILWIVGPRKMSDYAVQVLRKLFDGASNYDMVTISWMADGVDQLCHDLSIENWIRTIAVLGWWLKRQLDTPKRNWIEKIVSAWWLVLSEYKLDMEPTDYSFPQRNRIIAWLCDVLFLPEAGEKSGSLITADFALQMGKQVCGVPNSIFSSNSDGLNKLISSGQINVVVNMEEFLSKHFKKKNMENQKFDRNQNKNLSEKEKKILMILSENNWWSLQSLISLSWINADEIIPILTMLEMQGLIYQEWADIYKIR